MSGLPPTLYQNFRQIIGRALRETGQSLHRLGVKTTSLAITKHDYYDDPVIYEDHLSRHRQISPLPISGRPIIHQHVAYIAPCATLVGSVTVGRNSSIWYGAVLRGDTCENTISLLTKYKIELGIDENSQQQQHLVEGQSRSQTQIENGGTLKNTSTSSFDPASDTTEETKTADLPATTTATAKTTNVDISSLQNIPKPWKLSATRHKDQLNNHGGGIFVGNNTNVQDAAIITSYQNHCTIGDNVTIGHSAQLHSCTVHDNVLIGMGSIIHENAVVESYAFIAAGAVVLENTIVPTGTLWMGNPARYVRDLTIQQREKIMYQSSEYVTVAGTHQHVMELGGNVDPETGVAVYITSSEEDTGNVDDSEVAQLEQPSILDTIAAGNFISSTPFKADESNSVQQQESEPLKVFSSNSNR